MCVKTNSFISVMSSLYRNFRALDYMSNGISINLKLIADSLERKDGTFRGLKDELVKQMVEKRSREEEVYLSSVLIWEN